MGQKTESGLQGCPQAAQNRDPEAAGVPQTGLGLHVAENIFPDQALLPAVAVLTQFALDYLSGERG